ncbi:MAG: caspase family protein [Jatrophihabitantaceae bacterium]
MTRKALLIGAQTAGLRGALNDVEAMAAALRPRGFQIEQLCTPHATRAAILDAYEKLIVDARPEDGFVIYYSGHGGLGQLPDSPDLQFIAPDDYADSDDRDFRGITGVELSVLLARLSDVAHNTTVVLDCCHAAHMSRGTDLRIKSLLRPVHWLPTYQVIEEHVRRLVQGGLQVERRPVVGNLHAVRAVACALDQPAWEGTNRDGIEMGLFTDALSRSLRESDGLRLNWSTLMDTVRRQVQAFALEQRPAVEGPSERQPFESTELAPLDTLPVVIVGTDRIELLGAPLLGVEAGDEFAIMPAGATGPRDGPVIGSATVDQLLPTTALAQLRLAVAGQDVPLDARAHRTRAVAAALPVRLPGDHKVRAELVKAMKLRLQLRLAVPGADDNVTVEIAAVPDGRLVVRDQAGALHSPYATTPLGVSAAMGHLQRIAQATALRRLSGDPARPLSHHVVLEWGRVRDGKEEPLPRSGGLLFAHPGERIYVRLRNDGDQVAFVSLIDIGVSYRIAVLTETDPDGIKLTPGASYTYGWNDTLQELTGMAVTWPESTDPAVARPETIVALISDEPVDVSVLNQQANHVRTGRGTSGLEQLLTQVAKGASRDFGNGVADPVRFDVQPIDFTVSPTAPPAAEHAAFLLDDRPAMPVRLLSPRGAAPARVAVRINELIVHRNHAFGNADIRLDAVVQTGAGDGPAYRAETMRFGNIGDGCRLPLDDVLIYHGPARDFLDIAVWVSRDSTGSLALSDLLAQRLASPELRLVALAVAVPPPAVAMISAGVLLVNTACELLTGVAGRSIGLYRTSMLAQEEFGVGRHKRRPQEFSLTFSVESVA